MHMQYKVDPDDALALPSFRRLYALTALVGLLVAGDLLFWALGYENLRNPWGVNLALVAAILGGARIIYGALVALLEGDVGADLALAIAMLAALLLGEYWVAAEVVLIAMIGESLEALTFARTHREIARILELRPRLVRVRRGGQELEVPVQEVGIGEIVVLRPGERVTVDGTVLVGRSTVDQSTLTGESLPIDKGVGDQVFAGTINQFGALEVQASAVGEETTLGRVIQLVAEAQHHKARIERVADRLARYFLPFVLACAALTFLLTNLTALGELFAGRSAALVWMPTLAVLVVTCPCSLILATPAAMMAAQAWLARRGVLIKGGAVIEQLAGVSRIAFDKTGTLTTGQLELGDVVALGGHQSEQVLAWAAAAEQSSEHLIARAMVRAARAANLEMVPVEEFLSLPGAGVAVRIAPAGGAAARRLLVGNRRLLVEQDVTITPEVDAAIERLETTGQTPLLVSMEREVIGLIGVRDTLRSEAPQVVRELRRLGIEQIAVLSGDRWAATQDVARAIGADQVQAELRPEDKARWLLAWRRERPGVKVAMIGDGVNDAPALASADAGLALAGVGSDLAADAGDLLLMGDPLAPLPGLLKLSRETVRVIRQNILVFAFFVNFLGIVLTAWIMPRWSQVWLERSPVAAALFHQIGSVLVLLNAMRLLWFERWQSSIFGRAESTLAGWVDEVARSLHPVGNAIVRLWTHRRRIALGSAFALLVLYAASGIRSVGPDEVAVARRCGRLAGVLAPGLHVGLPFPWESVTRYRPARVRTAEIGWRRTPRSPAVAAGAIEWNSPHAEAANDRRDDEAVALTGDQSLVEVGAVIQYRISDVVAYAFAGREPDRLFKVAAEGAIREVLAGHPLLADAAGGQPVPEILTTARAQLQHEIRQRLQPRLDQFALGLEVLPDGVLLQDVHPPLAVVPAFRDVSSAFKEQERMKNEAWAYHRDKVIKAGGLEVWQRLSKPGATLTESLWQELRPRLQGEAAAELHAAEAFAASEQEVAHGNAESFLLNESARAAAPQLTDWRLVIDAVGESLAGKKKLILDHSAGGRRHLFLGLPPGSLLPGMNPAPIAPALRPEVED